MDYLDDTFGGDCDDIRNYPGAIAQDEKTIDRNGWFEVKRNPLSKEGVFLYKGSQIRLPDGSSPPDPNELYPIYRPADELSNPEAISSFKLIPWVDEHAMLGDEGLGFTPAEKKGVSGVIGEEVFFEDGTLYGNIKVFSEALAKRIENGKKELSLGYRCAYEHNPGVWNGQKYEYIQRDLRGNHLALVNKGRMGADVRVMDGDDTATCNGQITFTCDSQMEQKKMTLEEMLQEAIAKVGALTSEIAEIKKQIEGEPKAEPEVGGEPENPHEGEKVESKIEDQNQAEEPEPLDKILKFMESIQSRIDKVEAKIEHSVEDSEAKEGEEPKKEIQAMDEAEITRNVMKRISNRDRLYDKVKGYTGVFDASAMDSAEEVAVYACKKLGLKADKGVAVAMLNGYMANREPISSKKVVQAMDGYSDASFIDKQLTK